MAEPQPLERPTEKSTVDTVRHRDYERIPAVGCRFELLAYLLRVPRRINPPEELFVFGGIAVVFDLELPQHADSPHKGGPYLS
jgi:hypothetical protein